MQDSKRVLGFNCKKRIEQLNYFFRLWNVKNLVLWNGSELVRNVIQLDLNSFFSKNLQKSPSGWGLCPQTPIAIGGWGLCPQTPVSDTFEYASLLNTSSKLDFYTFQQLVFALFLYQNPGKVPSGYGFRFSILRYLCPTKNYFFEKFWWCHCVWFVVLAPPIKNPGYAYVHYIIKVFAPSWFEIKSTSKPLESRRILFQNLSRINQLSLDDVKTIAKQNLQGNSFCLIPENFCMHW